MSNTRSVTSSLDYDSKSENTDDAVDSVEELPYDEADQQHALEIESNNSEQESSLSELSDDDSISESEPEDIEIDININKNNND